jgi:hypothetical protein
MILDLRLPILDFRFTNYDLRFEDVLLINLSEIVGLKCSIVLTAKNNPR